MNKKNNASNSKTPRLRISDKLQHPTQRNATQRHQIADYLARHRSNIIYILLLYKAPCTLHPHPSQPLPSHPKHPVQIKCSLSLTACNDTGNSRAHLIQGSMSPHFHQIMSYFSIFPSTKELFFLHFYQIRSYFSAFPSSNDSFFYIFLLK